MSDRIRTRFAPSPTGSMHVGNAHTALFNWLYARKYGGDVVLRIEDTDELRSTPEAMDVIYGGLSWLGIDWDEGPDKGGPCGPYVQSERLDIYQRHVDELLATGKAYRCYCTPDEVEQRREIMRARGLPPRYDGKCESLTEHQCEQLAAEGREACIRFRMKRTGNTVINDRIQGEVVYGNDLCGDAVIMKASGFPTYHFAVVVDDAAMGITDVIRGDGHLPNTQIHLQLQEALALPHPRYAHLPMILGEDRTKLSKRHGAVSIMEYQELGYLPEAMVNILALLGWSPGDEREVLSREEILDAFSLEGCSKAASVFDIKKAEWLNGEYMKQLAPEDLARRVHPRLVEAGLMEAEPTPERWEWLAGVVDLMKERAKLLSTYVQWAAYFFTDEYDYEDRAREKWLSKEETPATLEALADAFEALGAWDAVSIEGTVRELAETLGVGAGKVIHPCRAAVTGTTVGPSLFHLLELIPREDVVARLRRTAELSRAGQLAPRDAE